MENRRAFIKKSAALATMGLFADYESKAAEKRKIGIGLFSVPKLLDQDFAGTMKMLAKMGYKEIEFYGPYTFSAPSAIARWKSITPSLGFSGSGYFGKSLKEVAKILKDNGLTSPSAHTDLTTLSENMGKLAEAAHFLGQKYVVLPSIPDELRKNLDDYKKMAERFNKIGESAKKHGIRFGYHNHGYGLSPMEGQIPLDIILNETDPNLVYFEMDLYWTIAGGADPVELMTKYPNRYKMLHIKDMKEKKRFAGDGGDPKQWIELFPYMTSVGSGVFDMKSIIDRATQVGIKHFFVEQDMVADPEISLKKSIDYLNTLK